MNRFFFFFCFWLVCCPLAGQADEPALREMLGQMVMVGFRGDKPGPAILRDIQEYHVGGVILFDVDATRWQRRHPRNIMSPDQVGALTAELQKAAGGQLFIALDQEGGQVTRLKPQRGFPAQPSAAELGAGPVEKTRFHAERLGRLLAELGINMNFAPVVDVNVNPASPTIGALGRSFSNDPYLVARHAQAVCQGLGAFGVMPCLKHFPGHGSADADSHRLLPDISTSWSEKELIPYLEILRQGGRPAIMVGHLFLRQFDPQYPATLSPALVTGLLRQRLGFDGLIISDNLQMGAISRHYSLDEAVVRAVNAGVDILLFSNNNRLKYDEDIVPKVVTALERAVREGRISQNRVCASWRRITRAKAELLKTLPKKAEAMSNARQ